MSKREEKAGAKHAEEEIQGEYFQNWVRDQLLEASRMDPEKVHPLETKEDARVIARKMLQQLGWDASRDRNESADFIKGFKAYIEKPNVRDWLADELLEIQSEMRGARPQAHAREAARVPRKRTGTPVRYKHDLWEVLAWDGDWRTRDMVYSPHHGAKAKGTFWSHDEAKAFATDYMIRYRPLSRDAQVRISDTTKRGDTSWHELWGSSPDGKAWVLAGTGRYATVREDRRRSVREPASNEPNPALIEALAADVNALRLKRRISFEQAYDEIEKPTWVYLYRGNKIDLENRVINKAKSIGRARGRTLRDYEATDSRGKHIAGPFKSHSDAKDAAGPAGVVKFVPKGKSQPNAVREVRREVAGEYRTRTGKQGAIIHRTVSPRGVTYSYTGEWGAGSGISATDMQAHVSGWLRQKRGIKTVIPFAP